MTILINLIGILLIILIYWFFFMKKESESVDVANEITITVEGGYKPDVIRVRKGSSVTLKFYRKDESSCLEEVVIPDFNIREHLGLNKTTDIVINPSEVGEYEISCGMNMFHGKIKVEE
jgi:plastocyanin domain-containing protein